MDGWARRLPSLCPSSLRGQKAHNVVIALTKRKNTIPFSFLSFFLSFSSFSDCVRWRFERFERFERACLLPHKRNGNLGVVPPLARSLGRQSGEELSISEVFKPPNQRWKWNCQGGGRARERAGGGGARVVYRKWRVQMNGVRFGARIEHRNLRKESNQNYPCNAKIAHQVIQCVLKN